MTIQNNSENSNQEFSESEKNLFISAINKLEENQKIGSYDQKSEFKELKKKLEQLDEREDKKNLKWIENFFLTAWGHSFNSQGTIVALSLILIGGLVGSQISWLLSKTVKGNPTQVEIFRGYNNNDHKEIRDGKENADAITKIIEDNDPNQLTHKIIDAAIDAGIKILLEKKNQEYYITIFDLKPMNENQVTLKAMIGISNQQNGNILIHIKKLN